MLTACSHGLSFTSCPVCRYQLPADEPKTDSVTTTSDNNGGSSASATSSHGTGNSGGNHREEEEEDESEGNNGSGFSIPWPFSTLFSSSHDSNASTDSS